jgi:hypothetical protein
VQRRGELVADPGTHKVVDAVACGLEFWLHSDGVERGQGLGEGTHHPTLLGFGWLDRQPSKVGSRSPP